MKSTNQFAALKSGAIHVQPLQARPGHADRFAVGLHRRSHVRVRPWISEEEAMLIFFDCEFTELGLDPKLISIGLVSEDGSREFYAELNDSYQPKDCSAFVQEAVLAHLQGGDALMTMRELSVRLVEWLIAFNQPVQLATDSISWDWPWICELFAEAGEGTDWPAHMTTQGKAEVFRPANVAANPLILTQSPVFNLAVERAFKSGLRRHHALDDAKANRLAWLAMREAGNGETKPERFSV